MRTSILIILVLVTTASVAAQDAKANDEALGNGARILSAYDTQDGTRLWIITEAEDDCGQRAATTILLPQEY